jgi:hypothetical protein
MLIGAAPFLYYMWKGNHPEGGEHENKPAPKDAYKTFEEEHPIEGRSRKLVNLFVKRLSEDPVLSKYFNPHMLQPHSLYAVILERYMLVAMGEPVVEIPIDLHTKHKHMNISKENFDRFKNLWKECEKEMGIEGKDIWDSF